MHIRTIGQAKQEASTLIPVALQYICVRGAAVLTYHLE